MDPKSADILLCHNCNWNADLQQHNFYVSTIKCVFAQVNRGVWQIGSNYILKERPLISYGQEEFIGPDVVTTNWVRENTTIPVPAEMREWKDDVNHFFWMKKMPGRSLQAAWPEISTEEKKKYAREVAEYIVQLRAHTAPKPQTVDGQPVRDTLLNATTEKAVMLFEDEEAWWASVEKFFARKEPAWRENFKARYPLPNRTAAAAAAAAPFVLTHGDLNTGNIMIHEGHVSGIIDWEHAGYYPDWWEYAAASAIVEELEWRHYLLLEMGDRFGKFNEEARFCMDFLRTYECPELPPREECDLPVIRDQFCDCKPYRNGGF